MQCGPSHVKCGCNVGPPNLHILNVDVMWSNVDALWSNFDFHISNVNKCRYIVGQHNGDLRLFWINSKLMWTATLKMWIHHISTS